MGRKILIAVVQHVIYNEYLPSVLGKDLMDRYGLLSSGQFQYDESIDPAISNAFTTAGKKYRFFFQVVKNFI